MERLISLSSATFPPTIKVNGFVTQRKYLGLDSAKFLRWDGDSTQKTELSTMSYLYFLLHMENCHAHHSKQAGLESSASGTQAPLSSVVPGPKVEGSVTCLKRVAALVRCYDPNRCGFARSTMKFIQGCNCPFFLKRTLRSQPYCPAWPLT